MNISIEFILKNAHTIAILGASRDSDKDSHKIMKYLQTQGYKTIPINPYAIKERILGEKVYKNLGDINKTIDIVNVFRPSSEIVNITKDVINKKINTVWLQLDIFCESSKKILNNTNINFVQNKCIKVENNKIFNFN